MMPGKDSLWRYLLLLVLILFQMHSRAQTDYVNGNKVVQKKSPSLLSEVDGDTTLKLNQVHDPVMIKQDSIYYLFCTGMGINIFSSTDMKNWKKEKPVFSMPPKWAMQTVKGYRGHTWAPDISYVNGKYYLYYSISAFGKNTSSIGLAVNNTLHPASPGYKWEDLGKVIQSVPGRDMWNAIDPNLIIDGNNIPYLAFGSFWNGIKLVRLDSSLSKVAQPEEWYTIASRKRSFEIADTAAGDASIEAPFIFRKNNYYYLFVSHDYCCRGEKSDYKMVVGRSKKLIGPYVDKAGKALILGGGSILLEGDKNWHGVGHNAVIHDNGKDLLIYHGYDANDKGKSKLLIRELEWKDDWPEVKNE